MRRLMIICVMVLEVVVMTAQSRWRSRQLCCDIDGSAADPFYIPAIALDFSSPKRRSQMAVRN